MTSPSLHTTLETYLADDALPDNIGASAVTAAILGLSEAAIKIARLAAFNGLSDDNLGALAGGINEDGDDQKQLDVIADRLVQEALSDAGVATYFSEEQSAPIGLHNGGALGVACDPLDGSSNIDTNMSIGTIFSVFAMADCAGGLPPAGRKQIAAGIFVYGPQTALLLSFGKEVLAFALSYTQADNLAGSQAGNQAEFRRLAWDVAIPKDSAEFAINASNAAFWPKPIADYIYEVSYGDGAQGSGMRWLGSLVADATRIFRRGGVFLYPQDSRPSYEQGRLRLIYEANPLALLVEAAGGKATTGTVDILDVIPTDLHQRVPLIFGSANVVDALISQIQQKQ